MSSPKERHPQTEAGLNELLHSPGFLRAAQELGSYTLRTAAEGAFAVYNRLDASGEVSDMHLPKDTELNHGDPRDSVNLSPLVANDNEGLSPRNDVQLVVHSHPESLPGFGSLWLAPGDTAALLDIEQHNPGHVFGILQQNRNAWPQLLLCRTVTGFDPSKFAPEHLRIPRKFDEWETYLWRNGIRFVVASIVEKKVYYDRLNVLFT